MWGEGRDLAKWPLDTTGCTVASPQHHDPISDIYSWPSCSDEKLSTIFGGEGGGELMWLVDHKWPTQTLCVICFAFFRSVIHQIWCKNLLYVQYHPQCPMSVSQPAVYWYFTSPGLSLVGCQIRHYDGISRTDSKTSLVRRLIADEMRQSRER